MSTVKLRNINPLGQVDLPLIARQGDPIGEYGSGCLEPGEVFEVDAKHAGRPPKLDKAGNLAVDDDGQVIDAGEGLLAQVGNYELADKPAPKKTQAKRRPRKTAAAKPDPTPPSTAPAVDTIDDTNAEA